MNLKFKKITAFCVLLIVAVSVTTFSVYAENDNEPNVNQLGGQPVVGAVAYANPQDIVISQPGETYSTSGSRVSILGACDYMYPLYMNGTKIETTEHGFFAVYVDLKAGNNAFTFTNNGKSKTVNITKKSGGTSGGGGSSSNIKYWPASHEARYAVVKGHNISRMSKPGGDDKELMMPLATGTTAQIIGEAGNLYCLSDYSFVYKSNVTVKTGLLGKNAITKMDFTEDNGYNCMELQLSMPQKALYNLEVGEKNAILTVYNTNQAAWGEIPQNRIVKSVDIIEDGSKGYVKYLINFQKNPPINGYYVEFTEGKMLIGFKELPTVKEGSLEGVRIHIDAGHGGSDIGAKGPLATYGPTEKDINLSIALYAKQYLESKGATVIMTRTDDSATELSARAEKVAAVKPDFSLSVHCNSMPVTANYNNAKGFLTFYSFNGNNAPEYINSYMADKLGIGKSSARYSNLAMTRMTLCPAVLFETSFMSNPADYEFMLKEETRKQFGIAAGEAIENFIRALSQQHENTYA